MHTLSVSLYRRPQYTFRVLDALSCCFGIEDFVVFIHCDVNPAEPRCEEVVSIARKFASGRAAPMRWAVVDRGHPGCNGNIVGAVDAGFGFGGAANDFHIHLEDDTLPHHDFLSYMRWASREYYSRPEVMSVCGYSRDGVGRPTESITRRWFTPWGWGTWRDRWARIRPLIDIGQQLTWDCQYHEIIKRWHGREAAPALGRIQNIGEFDGTNNTPEFWAANQKATHWAGDEPTNWGNRRWIHAGEEDA